MSRVCGLIGDPVAHSLSPAMQNAAFQSCSIPASYVLWPTPAAELSDRIATLRHPEVLGANVTIPHKLAVGDLLDDLAPSARLVGAVNTIVKDDGRLVGHNTDADGLAEALYAQGTPQREIALVLGAGGATRAAVIALAQFGARCIAIAARRYDAAALLAHEMAKTVPDVLLLPMLLPDNESDEPFNTYLARTQILINTTPVGMRAHPGLPLSQAALALLPTGALVVDLITMDTHLLQAARERGYATLDGLPMLLYQGALAFTLWTGQAAPIAVMRAALQGA